MWIFHGGSVKVKEIFLLFDWLPPDRLGQQLPEVGSERSQVEIPREAHEKPVWPVPPVSTSPINHLFVCLFSGCVETRRSWVRDFTYKWGETVKHAVCNLCWTLWIFLDSLLFIFELSRRDNQLTSKPWTRFTPHTNLHLDNICVVLATVHQDRKSLRTRGSAKWINVKAVIKMIGLLSLTDVIMCCLWDT